MRHLIALVVAMAAVVATAATALGASCPGQCQTITSSPLTVVATADSSLQIFYQGTTQGQVFSPSSQRGNAGTWIGVGGRAYEPSDYTAVSQSAVTGSGSAADPFTVETVYDVSSSGLRVTETIRLVSGNPYFRIDRRLTNTGGNDLAVRVFHYADLYLLGSDRGYGYYDTATGAVGGQNEAANFFQAFIPITPATSYMEGRYSVVRDAVRTAAGGGASLANTILAVGDTANLVDNGAALQWDVSIRAGSSRTISDFWSFGVTPQIPAVTAPPDIAALQPAAGPAGTAVTITGTRFGAAPGTVTVRGVTASVTSWSDTRIVAVVPALSAGAAPVTVARSDESSDPMTFTVTPAAPNLATTIPSPGTVRGGPTQVTYPRRVSLRSLRSSRCIRVVAVSRRPARVLVTIFSGRRSIRLFGQKDVRFLRPGRKIVCIPVPRRAHTFNVRTPLSFALGWKLGSRPVRGEVAPPPRIVPIRLVP